MSDKTEPGDTMIFDDGESDPNFRVPQWHGADWRDGAGYLAGRSDEQAKQYIRDHPRLVLGILRAALENG